MNRRLFLALAAVLLAWTSVAQAGEKTRIVLVGRDADHSYTMHEYMTDLALLARCLRQTPGVEVVVSNGWPKDPAVFKGVNALVLHTKKGGNLLFGSPARREAEQLLQHGVGLTAIHWSTGADRGEAADLWLRTVGGWFDYPGGRSRYEVRTATVHQADPKHPICRGWKDYQLKEEYYLDMHWQPEIRVVITSQFKGQEAPFAWVYDRPGTKGARSFGFLGGHFHVNFGERPFRQAIVNGILWTAHRDVPESGAPCAIRPQDMVLPPDTRKTR